MKNVMTLPEKTIERLSGYRRILLDCLAKGKTHVYSHELAALNHITAVQVRRDMMLMGFSSMQRKGYGIKELIDAIGVLIDTKKGLNIAVVGLGNLGRAVTTYFRGKRSKLNVVAIFDVDPEKIGRDTGFGADESFAGLRVLVAEDNAVNQKLIEMMLHKLGCTVGLAANGKELVDIFSKAPENWDIIFMDIQMPEMDGFEALKVLREKGFRKIPVVAVTAHAMREHRQECLAAGMNEYISKPIRRPELLRILRHFAK